MFSTVGTLAANSVVSFSLLSTPEVIAASTVLIFSLGGLVLLAWLTQEPVPTQNTTQAATPNIRKAA